MQMRNNKSGIGIAVVLAMIFAFSASAISLSKGTQKSRSTYPRGLSGITYVGEDRYYAVCDNGNEIGLYPCTVTLSSDGKTVDAFSTVATNAAVRLPSTSDLEACAYDPATGNIWVADEAGKTIKEYTTNGVVVQSLPIPNVMTKINGNYGFESLTISGDGLTLWTANEEALTVDGNRSSYDDGTLVRIVKYVRDTVNDKFKLVAMYPYKTEKWHNRYALGGSSRRGVADLCALPDGSLLVLERELSGPTDGSDFWAKLDADFYYAIYRVSDFSMVTDVKGYPSLSDVPVVRIQKELLFDSGAVGFHNYEGICFGKRISDDSISLLMVTDSGDGNSASSVQPLVLSGLNVRTLAFNKPDANGYTASIVGNNYRYLDGAQVSVGIIGDGAEAVAYTNNGSTVVAALWSIANQSPASGSGVVANFTVGGDGVLIWALATSTAATPILASDSFEAYAVGTQGNTLPGWTGEDAEVVAETYSTSAGFPMAAETHTKVLSVDGELTRTYPEVETNALQKLDFMVAVRRAPGDLDRLPGEGNKIAIACDSNGCMRAKCKMPNGDAGWVALSNAQYANDDWVRVELTFDYESNGDGRAFAQVKLNGVACETDSGVVSPKVPSAGGTWYELLEVGSKRCVSSLVASGMCKLDDVIMTIEAPEASAVFADDGAEALAGNVSADTIAAYVNGIGGGDVSVVTKPMAVSYLLGANKVLTTDENAILKVTAIDQDEGTGYWMITVSTSLNATDEAAGAVINLNDINGTLKVVATDDLGKQFAPVDASNFEVNPSTVNPRDAVITVKDDDAKFLKAMVK